MNQQRPYPRVARVSVQIKQVVALELEKVRDPGLGYITITDVTLSPDFRNATVFYTVYGDEPARLSSADALERAAPHFRSALARLLRMRRVPALTFELDPVPAAASKVETIIADLNRKDEQ